MFGNCRQSIAFRAGQRRDVVVVAVDENLAARVAHAVDQMRERDDRIGRPVAVVTAVQRPRRTIDRNLEVRHSACGRSKAHVTALMDRAVA